MVVKEELDWTTNELRNSLRSIEWDLEDLEETINILFFLVYSSSLSVFLLSFIYQFFYICIWKLERKATECVLNVHVIYLFIFFWYIPICPISFLSNYFFFHIFLLFLFIFRVVLIRIIITTEFISIDFFSF